MSLLLPCGGIHDDANKILKLKEKKTKWLCEIRSHHKYSYRPISQPLSEWHSIVIKFNSFSIHIWMSIDIFAT